MLRLQLLALLGPAVVSLGCADKSVERVLLTARIESPEVTVEERALVTVVRGRFSLVLELGDLAEDPSRIETAPSFSLVRSDDQNVLLGLDALPEDDTLPFTIRPGEQSAFPMALTDENTVGDEEFEAICGATLSIAGSLRDAAYDSQPTAFSSADFSAQGCL